MYTISHLINLNKKKKNNHYVPVLLVNVNGRLGKAKYCTHWIILYSGARSLVVVRKGHRMGRGHCMGRFRPSCVRLVYFLRKSTEFRIKRTECQRILLLAIAKRCPLLYARHNHYRCPLSYSLHNHSSVALQFFPNHSPVELCFSLPSKF